MKRLQIAGLLLVLLFVLGFDASLPPQHDRPIPIRAYSGHHPYW